AFFHRHIRAEERRFGAIAPGDWLRNPEEATRNGAFPRRPGVVCCTPRCTYSWAVASSPSRCWPPSSSGSRPGRAPRRPGCPRTTRPSRRRRPSCPSPCRRRPRRPRPRPPPPSPRRRPRRRPPRPRRPRARRPSGPAADPPVPRAPVPATPVSALPPVSPPPVRDIAVYKGLGTWVDAYDFSPQFQPNGGPPPVTPESMDDIAAAGVKTLYLQAAKDDTRSPGDLVNPEILGPMLVRAHARGLKVVAWYLPKFYDLDSDMRRLLAMRDFRAEGHGFDGMGLDIEWTKDVPDPGVRNARLVELSQRLRAAV